MSDDSSSNSPYKPQQPRIPGVPDFGSQSARGGSGPAGSKGAAWAIIGVAVLVSVIAAVAVDNLIFRKPTQEVSEVASSPAPSVSKPAPEKPQEVVPIGPGPIATRKELAKEWSSKRFDFRDEAAGTTIQGLVVHLPGDNFWAFSIREPYGSCTLQYLTDLNEIQSEYNYTSSYPLVGDPCNQSLFDLTKYGGGPSGMVRGQIVEGRAVRPPVAIELKVKGDEIIAVRPEE
jgi:hypothetical protein